MAVTVSDIWTARAHLPDGVIRTPILTDAALNHRLGCTLYVKAEPLQVTGSFKVRGAYTRMRQLSAEARTRGVITMSAGNHALGVAYAAERLGVSATAVMPRDAVAEKAAAVAAYGVRVVRGGPTSVDMAATMNELAERDALTVIHPFDDPHIIAGQGTLGLEIMEDLPELDAVVCPVSGGGLLSGVAIAVKSLAPGVQVIGVQPEGANAMQISVARGRPTTIPRPTSIADGLLAARPGDLTFAIIQRLVDDLWLVSDAAILAAMGFVMRHFRIIAEPSGAASLAAVFHFRDHLQGKRVAVVLSGGNASGTLIAAAPPASEAYPDTKRDVEQPSPSSE